jgi:hypothetical protein
MGPGLQPRFGAVSSLLLTFVLALWPAAGWTGNELAREILPYNDSVEFWYRILKGL